MLKQTRATSKYSIFRRIFFPIFYASQIWSLLPMVFVCLIALVLSRNIELFAVLLTLGYTIYVISMQRYVPFVLTIPNELLNDAINHLDNNTQLIRNSEKLEWKRRVLFSFAQTELDIVAIASKPTGPQVVGMKKHVDWLASLLG